jgi:hypothetical protein
LIVLAVVVIVIALVLWLPIVVEVKYIGEEFSFKVKYAFITFYPKKDRSKPKAKSSKTKSKGKSKSKPKDTSKTKAKPKEKKSSTNSDAKALDTLGLVLDIFKGLKKDLGKFITSIKFTNLYINFQVADLDACECALKFGKLNAILGNVLGFLSWHFTVKRDSISIVPKYNSDESVYDVSFKVKLGVGKGLGRILVMLFKVLPILSKYDVI